MPVTARVRTTTQVTKNGKVIKNQTKEGNYFRSSDGSVLKQWTKVDDSETTALMVYSDLWDNKTATSYQLDFANHKAYEHDKGQASTGPSIPEQDSGKGLPEANIQGVRCKVFPTKLVMPGKDPSTAAEVGHGWISIDYNLALKQDWTYPAANGGSVHITYELFDLHLGQEPDRSLFDVQKNFTVYKPSSP